MEPTRSIEPLCRAGETASNRILAAARPRIAPTLRGMDRRSALVLLIVFGTGVFLAGLELMITAVALPSILDDLADPAGGSAWIELRKASWIINGYLLVYILAMPLAGRMTDLWGARRPFMAALVDLHRRVDAGGPRPEPRPAHRGPARPGGRRRRAGAGREAAAAAHLYDGPSRPRALGVIGALTFLGMAVGPFIGAAVLSSFHPEDALEGAGLGRIVAGDVRAVVAVGLLHQRADRPGRPAPRVGCVGRLGHAPATRSDRRRRGVLVRRRACSPGSSA